MQNISFGGVQSTFSDTLICIDLEWLTHIVDSTGDGIHMQKIFRLNRVLKDIFMGGLVVFLQELFLSVSSYLHEQKK